MSLNSKKPRRSKRYSESFKRARVLEYESGSLSARQISALYKVSFQSVYRWISEYSIFPSKGIIVVEQSESTSDKVRQLELQISKLKEALGDKVLELEFYKELISQAEQHHGIEIEKNNDTPPWK